MIFEATNLKVAVFVPLKSFLKQERSALMYLLKKVMFLTELILPPLNT